MVFRYPPRCDRTGCPNEGTRHPVLLLKPVEWDWAEPAQVVIGILVCDEHQRGATAADFISDEGWGQIEDTFRHRGVLPDRATAGLAWERP